MGSIVTRDGDLHLKIKLAHMRMGWGVGGNDAETILRSLPSLALRYRAHDVAARQLARWLQGRPEIAQLLHPAFEGSPGHAHWRALCGGNREAEGVDASGHAAGLFSVVFDKIFDPARVDVFCNTLKLFRLGFSWGGPVSLAVPYDVKPMRSAALRSWTHDGVLVRLSVGLEAVDDLRADLSQALTAMHDSETNP